MRTKAPMISRRRLLAAAAVAVPAVGLARMVGTQDVGAANATVNIVNFTFNPSPLTISQGDTVTWTNQDTAAHTVTSDTAGQFNSGPLQKGQSVKVTFNKAGTYAYHCNIHPNMHGTITVNQVFAAIAVQPGSSAQQPPDFVQVPPPTQEAPPPPGPAAPAAVVPPPAAPQPPPAPASAPPAAPAAPAAPPVAAPVAPPAPPPAVAPVAPPSAPPPAPPRTGEGGGAEYIRRLGDG